MRLNKSFIATAIYLCLAYSSFAQTKGDKEYFFPVRPGEKNYLSGTMGEIRPSHFHAGMDIKTSGISGLPVYATKDGHISRIRVGGTGYGSVLYIKHADGETSVYGHLLRFRKDINDFVINEQYKKESFEINIFPDANKFPLSKGDLIALSGNTGSSQGPHLHFEIRNSDQWPVNPLKKHYTEIKDEVPPTVLYIALKTMDINSRVNNQFGRFEFKVNKRATEFYLENPIEVYGNIGIQIYAYDKFSGASNRNGIPYITTYFDAEKQFEIKIDSFSFSQSNKVLNYYDFEVRATSKKTFQKLYIEDGNELPIYAYEKDRGIINITDDKVHEMEVILSDIHENTATLIIPFIGTIPAEEVQSLKKGLSETVRTHIFENIMKIESEIKEGELNHAFLYANRMMYELMPSYASSEQAVFLWDMRLGMPDSVSVCGYTKKFEFEVMVPSGFDFNFYNKVFDIKSFRKSLYDTLFLEASYKVLDDHHLEIFTLGNTTIPLANAIEVNFKPTLQYSSNEKYAVYSTVDFNNFAFEGNDWEGNEISIKTKNLGSFTILEDTIPPSIKALRVSGKKVSFSIKDDLSGIKEYKAYLNDEWLLFSYDPKRDYIWALPKKENIPIKGELILIVEDQVGNINNYKTQIN